MKKFFSFVALFAILMFNNPLIFSKIPENTENNLEQSTIKKSQNINFLVDIPNTCHYGEAIPVIISLDDNAKYPENDSITELEIKIQIESPVQFRKSSISKKNFDCTYEDNNQILHIKLKKKRKIKLKSNKKNEVFSFELNSPKICENNKSKLNIEILNVNTKNWNIEKNVNNKILNFNEPNYYLKGLNNSCGSLDPGFKSNIFDYVLNVDHNTKEVVFNPIGMTGNENVEMNNKKVNITKKTSKFTIKVRDKKTNMKKIYKITINRLKNKPSKIEKIKKKS
ncbi:MAG: cadherin-like beta sandwich domain-containing protein [Candidatus Improbicoccus devescovinae]|nr:MAG: cadherin-like beta sandwich domain-containing protein [Candidatus Improbicoccus devescovinae]